MLSSAVLSRVQVGESEGGKLPFCWQLGEQQFAHGRWWVTDFTCVWFYCLFSSFTSLSLTKQFLM